MTESVKVWGLYDTKNHILLYVPRKTKKYTIPGLFYNNFNTDIQISKKKK